MAERRTDVPLRVVEISVAAISKNLQRVREMTGGSVIAIVKANAYGHGATLVAQAAVAAGADMLGVVDVNEALALRDAGVSAPILCWLHSPRTDFREPVAQGIHLGVSSVEQLDRVALAAEALETQALVQLKVDTGLRRGGAAPDDWADLFQRAARLVQAGTINIMGLFSHLANASPEADRKQAAAFDAAADALANAGVSVPIRHLAASAAILASPHLHYNAARVGLAMYGLSPIDLQPAADFGLSPALTFKSEIVATRQVEAGASVGYGHIFTSPEATTLALVPVGYADGVPRSLSGAGMTVMIRGEHYPLVGRVSMDQIVVDLGANTKALGPGDEVVLFGDPATGARSADDWARVAETISYEIVTGIGPRVQRIAVDPVQHAESLSQHEEREQRNA